MKSKIDYLKQEFGIESLLLKSILQSNKASFDEVMNFTNVDYFESVNSFQREIIDYAKSRGKSVIMNISLEFALKVVKPLVFF